MKRLLLTALLLFICGYRIAFAASDKIYEGHYVWGAEVETFAPCDVGDKTWWVLATPAISKRLSKAHQDLTTTPYEGVYARVSGKRMGPATERAGGTFSLQYDGLFKVTKVWLVRKTGPNDCKGAK